MMPHVLLMKELCVRLSAHNGGGIQLFFMFPSPIIAKHLDQMYLYYLRSVQYSQIKPYITEMCFKNLEGFQ